MRILLLNILGIVLFGLGVMILVLHLANHPTKRSRAFFPSSPSPEILVKKAETYQVPILMYHYIRPAPPNDPSGERLSVAPTNFVQQVEWLKNNHYQTLKLADLADPDKRVLSKILSRGDKPIILTFDDGYRDAYTSAYPALKDVGFVGTFFIIRDFVGRVGYMDRLQIETLQKEGMEIGSHTLSHVDLKNVSFPEARRQVSDSKQDATVFCYPSGRYNQQDVNIAKESGYVAAVTTLEGIATEKSDLYQLPRLRIKNVTIEDFIKQVSGA